MKLFLRTLKIGESNNIPVSDKIEKAQNRAHF